MRKGVKFRLERKSASTMKSRVRLYMILKSGVEFPLFYNIYNMNEFPALVQKKIHLRRALTNEGMHSGHLLVLALRMAFVIILNFEDFVANEIKVPVNDKLLYMTAH